MQTQTYQRSSRYISPAALAAMPVASSDVNYVTEAPLDHRFWGRINGVWDLAVALAGAIMQGRLYLAGDPVDPLEAVTLRYANSLNIDGGYYP